MTSPLTFLTFIEIHFLQKGSFLDLFSAVHGLWQDAGSGQHDVAQLFHAQSAAQHQGGGAKVISDRKKFFSSNAQRP